METETVILWVDLVNLEAFLDGKPFSGWNSKGLGHNWTQISVPKENIKGKKFYKGEQTILFKC